MNAFSTVEKFDFDFAVKFVKASEAGNGDNIFGIAQTGDALGIVITVLLALIAIGSFAAYFVRKRNLGATMGAVRPSVSGKHSAVSSAIAKNMPFSQRILLTIGCVTALATCLYTFMPMVSPAWAAYVNLPAVSVPVSDDGSTSDVCIHLKNTRDYPVRLNSFSSVLYGDSYTKEDNWTITTKVDGLDNQLYNDISDGHIEKLDYIKDYLLPGELIDLKIKVNTTPEQALGLVGQIFEADTLNMQDACVDVPEINDELVYNGKWQCPIEDFDIDNPAYTTKNTKTDTEAETSATTMKDGFAKDVNFDTGIGAAYDENYFTTITLNNGYVWEDGTTDPIECKWKITKAPLTVTTGSATQEYNNTYLTCDDITIDGLCSDEDGIVEIFDNQYAPKCPDGYMATGGMTSSPIPAEDAEPTDFEKYFKDVDVIENTYRIWWGDPEESIEDTHYAWENNYSITENLGTLEITKTDMIYFAPSQEYTYNGEAQGKPVETYPLNSDDYGTEGVPKETDDTRYIHFYYKTADDTDFKEYDYYGKDEDPRTDCPTITDVAESTTIEYKIESRNYHTVTGTYDLTINPLDAQLTWTPWATGDFTKVYDKADEFPDCTLSNVKGIDTVNVDVQVESVQLGKGFVTETKDVDIYKATAISLSGPDAENYNLIGVSDTIKQYTITPKEVTLTWDATTTFVYDGDAHVINATVKSTDVISGDSVNVTDYDLAANAPAALKYGEAIDAGSYTRTATALDNANYIIKAGDTSVSCDFLINAKVVSVTWDASGAAYTYNGEIQHPNAIIHGLVKDEYVIASTYKYVSNDEPVDSINVGEYTIYPDDLTFENGTPATNYVLPESPKTECPVAYSIKPKTVSLDWSFNDKEIVYDGVAHNATAQINDIVAGDTVNATYAYTGDSGSVTDCIDAGSYTATVSALDNPNYAIPVAPYNAFDYKIKQRVVELEWPEVAAFPYTGDVVNPTLVNTPTLADGETFSATYTYYDQDDVEVDADSLKNAGGYYVVVTPSVSGGQASVDNYIFTPLKWGFVIGESSAAANWPASSDEFVYDGQAHAPVPTISTNVKLQDGYTKVEPVMEYYSVAADGTETPIDAANIKDAGKYKAKIAGLQATGAGKTPKDLDPESCKIFTGKELVYNIVPKDITLQWPRSNTYKYSGTVIKPKVEDPILVDGDTALWAPTYEYKQSSDDSTINPANPGDYYAKIYPKFSDGKSTSNYSFSPLTWNFSITEPRVQIDWGRGAENYEADGNVYRPEPIISHNITLATGDTLVPVLNYEELSLTDGTTWTDITSTTTKPKDSGKYRVSVTGLKIVHGDLSETVVDVPIFGVTPFEYTIRATEAYAFRVKTSSATTNADEYSLTFYYDNQRIDRILKDPANNTAFLCQDTGESDPGWKSTNSNTKTVSFDSSFANARPKSCKYWFCDIKLNKITNLKYFDSSEVETMESMFAAACIENLDLSNLNTSKVTNMCMMFYYYGVSSLGANLDLSSFDTKNVIYMNLMFSFANLSNCNVSNFKMDNVENANDMFKEIQNLESVDLSGCDNIDKLKNARAMFENSKQLLEIKIPNFKMPNNVDTSFMFNGCCNLKTIYCNYDWINTSLESPLGLFYDKEDNMSLVGGNGTNWSSSHTGKDYAHPDQGTSNPGYFTKAPREPKMNLELQWSKSDEEFDYNGSARTPTAMAYTGDLQDPADKVVLNATSPYYDWTLYTYYKVEGSTKTKIDNISSLKDPGYYLVEYNPRVVDADGCYVTGDYTFTNTSFQFRIKPVTEAYAFLTKNVTTANADEYSMTFYYDNKRLDRLSANTGSQAFNCESTTLESYPPWYSYAESVTAVTFDECFKDARPKSCVSWFDGFNNDAFTHIDNLNYLNTSEVTSFVGMFNYATNLEALDLSNFNTSNATTMRYMFEGLKNIESLDCSSFDTSKVENMSCMFDTCYQLKDIDVSSFNTKNVEDFSYMFRWCYALTKIDISNFSLESATTCMQMFDMRNSDSKSSQLQTIYCNDDWSVNANISDSNLFGDCESLKGGNGTGYVASKTDKSYARPDGNNPGYFTKAPREGEKPHIKFKYDKLQFVETGDSITPEADYYECSSFDIVEGDVVKFKSSDVAYTYTDTSGLEISGGPVEPGTYRLKFQPKVYDSDGCDVSLSYTFEDHTKSFEIIKSPGPVTDHKSLYADDGTTLYWPIFNEGTIKSDNITFYFADGTECTPTGTGGSYKMSDLIRDNGGSNEYATQYDGDQLFDAIRIIQNIKFDDVFDDVWGKRGDFCDFKDTFKKSYLSSDEIACANKNGQFVINDGYSPKNPVLIGNVEQVDMVSIVNTFGTSDKTEFEITDGYCNAYSLPFKYRYFQYDDLSSLHYKETEMDFSLVPTNILVMKKFNEPEPDWLPLQTQISTGEMLNFYPAFNNASEVAGYKFGINNGEEYIEIEEEDPEKGLEMFDIYKGLISSGTTTLYYKKIDNRVEPLKCYLPYQIPWTTVFEKYDNYEEADDYTDDFREKFLYDKKGNYNGISTAEFNEDFGKNWDVVNDSSTDAPTINNVEYLEFYRQYGGETNGEFLSEHSESAWGSCYQEGYCAFYYDVPSYAWRTGTAAGPDCCIILAKSFDGTAPEPPEAKHIALFDTYNSVTYDYYPVFEQSDSSNYEFYNQESGGTPLSITCMADLKDYTGKGQLWVECINGVACTAIRGACQSFYDAFGNDTTTGRKMNYVGELDYFKNKGEVCENLNWVGDQQASSPVPDVNNVCVKGSDDCIYESYGYYAFGGTETLPVGAVMGCFLVYSGNYIYTIYSIDQSGGWSASFSPETNAGKAIVFSRAFGGETTSSLKSSSAKKAPNLLASVGNLLGSVFEPDESSVEDEEAIEEKSVMPEEQQQTANVKFEVPENSEFGKLHMECDGGDDGGKVEVENCTLQVPLGYTLQYKQNINNTGTIEMKDALGNFYWGCDVWTEGDLPLNSLIIEVDGQKHFLNEAYKFEKAGELKVIASTEVYVEPAAAIEEPAALPQTEQSIEGYTGPVTQDAVGNNIMQKAPDAGTTNEYSFNF